MELLRTILGYVRSHGTRMLGFAQGTVAALCGVAGIIPDAHLKYWLAASALLTYWRGHFNASSSASK